MIRPKTISSINSQRDTKCLSRRGKILRGTLKAERESRRHLQQTWHSLQPFARSQIFSARRADNSLFLNSWLIEIPLCNSKIRSIRRKFWLRHSRWQRRRRNRIWNSLSLIRNRFMISNALSNLSSRNSRLRILTRTTREWSNLKWLFSKSSVQELQTRTWHRIE